MAFCWANEKHRVEMLDDDAARQGFGKYKYFVKKQTKTLYVCAKLIMLLIR